MNTILIVLIAGLLVATIVYIIVTSGGEETSEDSKITQARLLKIKNKAYDVSSEELAATKGKNLISAILSDDEYKFALFGRFLERYNLVQTLKKSLKIAGMNTDVSQFMVRVIFIFIVGTLVGLVTPFSKLPWLVGLVLATAIPIVRIKMKTAKRLNIFTSQLPDALGLVASSLRAGHSMNSAFAMVTNELAEPIASIFKTACEDMNLGRSTKEALENMIEAMPNSLDLRFFVTAVLIQREIGGNLAEILDCLNNTIRERFKLLGQLKAQTAQASLSGIVLALAPVFIGGIIYLLNPAYMKPLFEHPVGKAAIGVAIFFGVVGYLIIKKITNIRV